MEERRKYVRFQAPFCIQYKEKGSGREYAGAVKDISMNGARILVNSRERSTPGSRSSFSVILPETEIPLPVKVVWSRHKGQEKELGLSYYRISDSVKEDIYNYIFKYYKSEITNKWWNF